MKKLFFLRYFTVEITQENCVDAINAHNSQVFSSQNQSIVVWIGQKLMKSDLNEKFNSTWLKNHRRGTINVCRCLHNGLFYEIEEKDLVVLFPGKLKEMTEKI